MDELVIIEAAPGNKTFQRIVHTLSSFGVAISCELAPEEEKELPIAWLNGTIVKKGSYPTKQELVDWLKFPIEFLEDDLTECSINRDGCCGCGCCYE